MATGPEFPDDYASARRRFIDAAAAAGARLDSIALAARAPDGAALAIDLAWLGASEPARLVVHVSGTHGVEGFAGSAVQSALLASGAAPDGRAALLLVHALNPFGMAWLRRVNENNVDLNRNCMPPGGAWSGAPAAYARFDPLLNPPSPPRADLFLARAAVAVLRHGYPSLRQAVAGGQYEYPRGLFYGGRALEAGPARYRAWLARRLGGVARCLVIDVHTGLGPWGAESLFVRGAAGEGGPRDLPGRRLIADPSAAGAGYETRGGHANLYLDLPGAPPVDFVTQEFGTRPGLIVLHALREENRWHHWGAGAPDHPAKRRLKEMFAPRDAAWQAGVTARGVSLARAALAWAAR